MLQTNSVPTSNCSLFSLTIPTFSSHTIQPPKIKPWQSWIHILHYTPSNDPHLDKTPHAQPIPKAILATAGVPARLKGEKANGSSNSNRFSIAGGSCHVGSKGVWRGCCGGVGGVEGVAEDSSLVVMVVVL